MDFEKLYKEALERAKAGKPLDEVFPELKENEDEKIMEAIGYAICAAAHQDGTLINDVTKDEAFAYLEKQKEKTNQTQVEREYVRTLKSLIADFLRGKEEIVDRTYYQDIYDWLDGYHVEQKRFDYPYVPGWRKNRDGNKPALKHSVLMLTTHGVAEGEWLGEKWCQYRWSCELKDNEILYWIHLSDLTQLEKEDEIIEKEQQPAEWSEEDEKYLAACIEVIDNFYTLSCELKTLTKINVLRKEYAKKLKSWLKSLRPQPHWKPSEEQMKALKHCVDGWQDNADGILDSLYKDLKTL